jgi:glycosyltransferase involved in cell wall biosynthesis
MRLLLTTHQFFPKHWSGTEVLARDTGVELARRGHEVHVLTADPAPERPPERVEFDDYEHDGLRVHSLRLPPAPSERDRLRAEYANDQLIEHLRDYAQALQPDAIHMLHLLRLSGAAIEAFNELDVPLVFTATDFWSVCVRGSLLRATGELCSGPDAISSNCVECRGAARWFPPRLSPFEAGRRRYHRELTRKALRRRWDEYPKAALARTVAARTDYLRNELLKVDWILSPTDLTRRLLIENGFPSSMVRRWDYGIDATPFRRARRLRRAPAAGDPLRLGYIGTISEHKGLHVLADAFDRLGAGDRATLRVCGSLGDYPDYTRTVLEGFGTNPNVSLAGPVPYADLPAALDRIDVLVVPSIWYENAPLIVYSALTAGIPVVASDLGGLSELIEDGINGLLFPAGDAAALAAALRRLVAESTLVERLSGATRACRGVVDSVEELLGLYAMRRGEAIHAG